MPTLQELVSEHGERQGQNLYVIQQGTQRLQNENLTDKERKKVQLEIAGARQSQGGEIRRTGVGREYSIPQKTKSTVTKQPDRPLQIGGASVIGGYSSQQQYQSSGQPYVLQRAGANPVAQQPASFQQYSSQEDTRRFTPNVPSGTLPESFLAKVSPEPQAARFFEITKPAPQKAEYTKETKTQILPEQNENIFINEGDQLRQKNFFQKFYTGLQEYKNLPSTPITGKFVSGIATGLVGTGEILIGATPFYYKKPFKTFENIYEYGTELFTPLDVGIRIGQTKFKIPPTPIFGRIYRTGQEIGELLNEDLPSGLGMLYGAGKGSAMFVEPIGNFAKTKFYRGLEKLEGVAELEKVYKLEAVKGNRLIVRTIETGRFAPTTKTPIELIPAQTIRQDFPSLQANVGKTVPVVHVSTVQKFKFNEHDFYNPKTILTAAPEKLSGTRGKLELTSFYRSSPNPATGTPRAYLGYAGINAKNIVPRGIGFSLIEQQPLALFEKVKIRKTPKVSSEFEIPKTITGQNRLTIKLLAEQEKNAGGTFLAAEDLSGLRPFGVEGQYTTVSRYAGEFRTGRPASVGSVLLKKRNLGSRYFYQNVVPEFFPAFLKNSDFYTKAYRIKLEETKTIPADKFLGKKDLMQQGISIGDSRRLNKRYYTPKDFLKNIRRNEEVNKEEFGIPVENRFSVRKRNDIFERNFRLLDNRLRFNERSGDRKFVEPINRIGRKNFRETNRLIQRGLDERVPLEERREEGRYEVRPPIIRERRDGPPKENRRPPISPPPRIPPRKENNRVDFSKRMRLFSRGFFPVIFRKGKPFKYISRTPLIRQEALAVGANYVNKDLRRSFKLVAAGGLAERKGISAPIQILRKGKRDPFLFVEKSKYALNTRGEVGEIQYFKRMKRKGFRGLL